MIAPLTINPSPLHGYGIFANRNIRKGEVVEECPYTILPYRTKDLVYKEMHEMFLTYPCNCQECLFRGKHFVLTTGYSTLYNCCGLESDADVNFTFERESRIIKTIANQNIKKDKEMLVWLGQNYYSYFVLGIPDDNIKSSTTDDKRVELSVESYTEGA